MTCIVGLVHATKVKKSSSRRSNEGVLQSFLFERACVSAFCFEGTVNEEVHVSDE